jgi:exosortase/archaeosortase
MRRLQTGGMSDIELHSINSVAFVAGAAEFVAAHLRRKNRALKKKTALFFVLYLSHD